MPWHRLNKSLELKILSFSVLLMIVDENITDARYWSFSDTWYADTLQPMLILICALHSPPDYREHQVSSDTELKSYYNAYSYCDVPLTNPPTMLFRFFTLTRQKETKSVIYWPVISVEMFILCQYGYHLKTLTSWHWWRADIIVRDAWYRFFPDDTDNQ